jgi:uncharacterized protein
MRYSCAMGGGIRDLVELVRNIRPRLNEGVFVYCSVPRGTDLRALDPIAFMREPEGDTLVLEESAATRAGLTVLFRAAWITLDVDSDLEAVGFTAMCSRALADAEISCNVIAGAHHDHLFVPLEQAETALLYLRDLPNCV